jgi:integrase
MRLIRANLHKLDKSDQLLVRLLACTGVRRGEAFAIDREQTEGGCRFVIVGTKTDQSLRRVPLPADLVKRLPKIKGTLFAGRLDSAGKRLSKWLHAIGITDPNKAPMHSFRHRAADRLRAAGCPQDIREELLGHERKTVADGYGKGHPVPVLKKWIDKIGM